MWKRLGSGSGGGLRCGELLVRQSRPLGVGVVQEQELEERGGLVDAGGEVVKVLRLAPDGPGRW